MEGAGESEQGAACSPGSRASPPSALPAAEAQQGHGSGRRRQDLDLQSGSS